MDEANVKPDSYIFSCTLKACGSLKALLLGRWIHKQILFKELETDLVLGNGMIGMYAKCGSLDDAYKVFEQLSNRDAVSWGTMVAGYVQQGHYLSAFELFVRMQLDGLKPSQVTLLVALKACGGIEALAWGRTVHGQVVEGVFESDVLIGSTLVDVYSKCGCLDDARSVFEQLQNRNVVSWSAMIAGYAQHGENFLALELYEKMQQGGVLASQVTFVCVLKACGNMEALEWGRLIHNQIIVSGMQVDMLVGSSLLDMYAKCGKLEEARRMFERLPKRDVVSWGAMIAGYSQHGQGMHALECFEKMQQQNIKSNKVTFLCSLKACGSTEALKQGQMIHDQIIKSDLESDSMVASSLIDMYGKCGSLDEAHCLFYMMRSPDVVAWGAVIAGYAKYEQGAVALELFHKMQNKHLEPDKFVFSCTLKACGSIGALLEGKLLHSQIICSGFDADRVVNNALIDMFTKCGSLREAREIFDNMRNRDAVSWGTMIAGYVQHGLGLSALKIFESLCQTALKPDKVIYVSILSACGELQKIEQGKLVHRHVLQSGIELEEVVGSSLVDMYVKCGDLKEARKVFNEWPKRSVISWDVMIGGYVEHDLNDGALELFVKMLEEHVTPNKAIFSCILKACGNTGAVDRGRLVHNMIIKDYLEADVAIGTTLVDMYVKCGNLYEAHQVLNMLTNNNVVSWGALIAGYSQHGIFSMVRQCLQAMEQRGIMPNDTIFLIILTACSHTAHLEDGLEFFKMMNNYGITHRSEHYSCMIDLLGRAGCLEEASDILNGMPLLPNNVGRTSLLGNSKTHGNLQLVDELSKQQDAPTDSCEAYQATRLVHFIEM